MTERFIVDTAGTLIDIETRDTFDIVEEVCPLLNEKEETITRLKKDFDSFSHNWALMYNEAKNKVGELSKENEQLKQQIKDLRLKVLDSLHDADDIQCSCNPCVVEECVKRVVE